MVSAQSFGEWLRKRRKALDITQDDLAECVGCSPVTIRMVENGQRRASRQVAELLMDCLQVPEEARAEYISLARRPLPVQQAPREKDNDVQHEAEQLGLDRTPPAPLLGNLPARLTALIGRDEELEALKKLLLRKDVRLVTLTGPPGVGKTSLAIEATTELQEDAQFQDGVFWVVLAAVRDPGLVIPTIALVLDVQDAGREPLADTLKRHLKQKHALLLLDNFEQVVGAAPAIADLLEACGNLKALVTSREALAIQGEREFSLPALPLPGMASEGDTDPEILAGNPAVALFVERAQSVDRSFALTRENASQIAAICRRLDGLPLAIELVAARVKLFSPRTLLAKLEGAHGTGAFRLLGDGVRGSPERHRTLQTAIGWSYDLLSKEEQTLFVRLGVFVGGFTLPAIEAVCNAAGDLGLDPLRGVSSLLDKSLLKLDQESDRSEEPRFHLLETIREYAESQLDARSNGEAAEVRLWHAEYFLAMVEAAEPGMAGKEQEVWFRRLEHDHDNIRAALAWLLEHGGVELAARLAVAASNFWLKRAQQEARVWLYLILEQRQHISPIVLSRVLRAACTLAVGLGNLSQAQLLAEENLDIARSAGNTSSIVSALLQLGVVAGERGDYAQAELSYNESLRLAREMGDVIVEAQATSYLAETARASGDYQRAKGLYIANLALAQEIGSHWDIAVILHNLGKVALAVGNPVEAEARLRESMEHFVEIGSTSGAAYCLSALGEAAVQMEVWERAATLFGASDALLSSLGLVMERVDRVGRDATLEQARERLGSTIFRAAFQAGQRLSLEQAVEYACDRQAS
jgi:predicted ATPase/DNA-binding XRE family transcriptional regulator